MKIRNFINGLSIALFTMMLMVLPGAVAMTIFAFMFKEDSKNEEEKN